VRKLTSAIAVMLAVAIQTPAFATTHMISDLTQGALLGPLTSSSQLQSEFASNGTLIASAGERLGLTTYDIAAVRDAVHTGTARYVELPRHLDGMAGEHHGHAFAVHDVTIPAHVYGWEIDVDHPDGLVRVFVPNTCGNISYLRVPKRRQLAAVAPYHLPKPVAYAPTPAPSPTPEEVAAVPPAEQPAPPTHRNGFLPFLMAIPLALLFHSGGGAITIGGPPPPVAPPIPGRGHGERMIGAPPIAPTPQPTCVPGRGRP
jgi:hypothetical protein